MLTYAHQYLRPQLGQLEEAGEKATEKVLPRHFGSIRAQKPRVKQVEDPFGSAKAGAGVSAAAL